MEIIVGKTAGFCFGVENAVNKAEEALKWGKELYCLGELVHNKEVTQELESKGLTFIDNIERAKKNIIIRAHGEPKIIYKKAQKIGLNIIDLTCPKVMQIHNTAEKYAKEGYYIILIGQKNHPETIGTASYCGKSSHIIEKEEDINSAINDFNNSKTKKILIISQTTFSMEKFNIISTKIKELISDCVKIEVKNTVCNATKIRQEETYEIAKMVDLMIIIGGKHSSNTNKLYNIAKTNCNSSMLIESEKELDIKYIKKFKKIGIMAGASTPQKSIISVVEIIKNI